MRLEEELVHCVMILLNKPHGLMTLEASSELLPLLAVSTRSCLYIIRVVHDHSSASKRPPVWKIGASQCQHLFLCASSTVASAQKPALEIGDLRETLGPIAR